MADEANLDERLDDLERLVVGQADRIAALEEELRLMRQVYASRPAPAEPQPA